MKLFHRQPWYAGGLAFECTQCGQCCAGPNEGYVWVNDAEVARLDEFGPKTEQQITEARNQIIAKISSFDIRAKTSYGTKYEEINSREKIKPKVSLPSMENNHQAAPTIKYARTCHMRFCVFLIKL